MKLSTFSNQSGHYRPDMSAFIGGFVLVGLVTAYLIWPQGSGQVKKKDLWTTRLPTGDIISTLHTETWSGTVASVVPFNASPSNPVRPILVNYMTNRDGNVFSQLCWGTTNITIGDTVSVSEVNYTQRTGGGVHLRFATKAH